MRRIFVLLSIGLGVAVLPSIASAQNQQGSQATRSPTVSPYLNLLTNSNPNVTNYQSLVRPMVNQNRTNAQERAKISRAEPKPATLRYQRGDSLRSTGHQASYQVYGHYYPTLGRPTN